MQSWHTCYLHMNLIDLVTLAIRAESANGLAHYQCTVLLEVKVLMQENNKYLPQVANSGFVKSVFVICMSVPHMRKRNGYQMDNRNT